LRKLREYWPEKVVVTEEYPPNFKLAVERLTPFSVKIVDVPLTDDGPMPFVDGEFDLVLNRHSGFNCNEVARVLSLGGAFITQQVHGLWAYDLIAAFEAKPQWPDSTLEKYVPRLKSAGLMVVQTQEWSGQLAFTDVGAIVYSLTRTSRNQKGKVAQGWLARGKRNGISARLSQRRLSLVHIVAECG
jgi:hypothetical protein